MRTDLIVRELTASNQSGDASRTFQRLMETGAAPGDDLQIAMDRLEENLKLLDATIPR